MADVPDKVERWTSGRRVALVLSILKGEISVQEAARKHALRVAEIEDWKDKFLSGANNALRSRPRNDEQQKDEEIKKLKQKVGELVLQVDVLEFAAANRALRTPGRTTSNRIVPEVFAAQSMSVVEGREVVDGRAGTET